LRARKFYTRTRDLGQGIAEGIILFTWHKTHWELIIRDGNQVGFRGINVNTNNKARHEIDPVVYEQNRHHIPPEVLQPYAGQWVAFSSDGTHIVTSGADLATAEANLAVLGIPGNSVGWERLPGLDEDNCL
jgi:hypothetical protein